MTDKCCKTCVFFVDQGYGECHRYPEPVRWVPPMSKQKPERHWCGEHTDEPIESTVTEESKKAFELDDKFNVTFANAILHGEESFTITTSDEKMMLMLHDMLRNGSRFHATGRSWVVVYVDVTDNIHTTAVFKPVKDTPHDR